LEVAAGSVQRLTEDLRKRGFTVVVESLHQPDRFHFNQTLLSADPFTAALAEAIGAQRRCLFVSSTGWELERQVGTVAALLRPNRTMVVARNRATADRFFDKLALFVAPSLKRYNYRSQCTDPSVFVSTSHSFSLCDTSLPCCILVAEADKQLNQTFLAGYSGLDERRLYGFVHDRPLDRRQRLELECLYGNTIKPSDTVSQPIRRGLVVGCKGVELRVPSLDSGSKAKHIWNNKERNIKLAKLATALINGRIAAYMATGCGCAAGLSQMHGGHRPVVVLVENAVHGRALQHFLPGWSLHVSNAADPVNPSPYSIETFVAFQRRSSSPSELVLRADAGIGGLPPRRPTLSTIPAAPPVVFDVVDRGDHRLGQRAASRWRAYAASGLEVCNCIDLTSGLSANFSF